MCGHLAEAREDVRRRTVSCAAKNRLTAAVPYEGNAGRKVPRSDPHPFIPAGSIRPARTCSPTGGWAQAGFPPWPLR